MGGGRRLCCRLTLSVALTRSWLRSTHVAQQLRPSVPHHHLGREPRAGDRLRGRWLPSRHSSSRWQTSRLISTSGARPVALHHPAPGADEVRILSGVFEDEATGGQVTTGTPISLVIENVDQRSKDYGDIKDNFRPGHADFTYLAKYGIRDYRGGGRSSARETAMRVAAGAVARKVVPACASAAPGPDRAAPIDRRNWDWDAVDAQPVLLPRRRRWSTGPTISTRCARPARRSAPSSRSSPKACRPGSARRSTASSTRTSPRR